MRSARDLSVVTEYVSHIPDSGVHALRHLIGSTLDTIYSPDVSVSFGNEPHEAHRLSIWLDSRRNKFLNISTEWITTEHGFDYHDFKISLSKTPESIPFRRKTLHQRAMIGSVASLEVKLGVIERVDVIEAYCGDIILDSNSESIKYDRALNLIGSSGQLLLSTIFQSILGTIEISSLSEPEPEELVEKYAVRLSLS